jgi:hypothetical protein
MPRMLPRYCLLLVLVGLLVACGKPAGQAAPLGDHAVLEQLATAYRVTAEQYPVAPRAMTPEGKRRFVAQVFSRAGYDYPATLAALAKQMDVTNPDHRDLAELLLLPRAGLADEQVDALFSPAERQALRTLDAALR